MEREGDQKKKKTKQMEKLTKVNELSVQIYSSQQKSKERPCIVTNRAENQMEKASICSK